MKRFVLLFGLFILVLSSCSKRTSPSRLSSNRSGSETGYASYYGNEFNGRKTASGEIFRQSNLTAAHKKLAFGTKVRVTNLANGKTVTVRVNDRGPFVANRIIDLSKSAANKIDMVGAGVAKVKIKY
jgi:rare lipoprotein A